MSAKSRTEVRITSDVIVMLTRKELSIIIDNLTCSVGSNIMSGSREPASVLSEWATERLGFVRQHVKLSPREGRAFATSLRNDLDDEAALLAKLTAGGAA